MHPVIIADKVGVLLKDPKGNLAQEMKSAMREGKTLLLVRNVNKKSSPLATNTR